MRIWYLILAILSFPVWATTFRAQTVEQQLSEADGIIVGNFLRQKSVRLDSGMIATQMVFKVSKEWGLQSETFGMDEVIVHYPGGAWEDQRVEVAGVPSFVSGEKVVLLSKSMSNRFWGLNLGMGSYKVVNYGNETILINSIFPTDPIMGQVPLTEFESKVKKLKGSNLKTVQLVPLHKDWSPDQRLPASVEEGKKRTIASSAEDVDNKGDQSGLSAFWLVIFLAVLGGVFRFMGRDA